MPATVARELTRGETICLNCGKIFQLPTYQSFDRRDGKTYKQRGKKVRFCSQACVSQSKRRDQQNRVIKKRSSKCLSCKKKFLLPLMLNRKGQLALSKRETCSEYCQRKLKPAKGWIDDHGYERAYVKGEKVRIHRHVMEQLLGRKLLRSEHVHHKNGIKMDNRPENLQVMVGTPHFGEVKCPKCQLEFLVR